MGARFSGPITIQGVESDDGRLFHEFVFRTMPLSFRLCQKDTGWAHEDAEAVGVLESVRVATEAERAEVERELQITLPADAVVWWGDGEYGDWDAAALAEQRAEKGAQFISADPGGKLEYHWEILDPQGEVVDPEDVRRASDAVWIDAEGADELQEWLSTLRERTVFDLYEVGSITQLDIACWHACRVHLADGAAAAAAGDGATGGTAADGTDTTERAVAGARALLRRVTASAGTKWPAAAFRQRSYTGFSELTITDDRRVSGHVAPWTSCHRGFAGQCVKPAYQTTFPDFHTSAQIDLDDGTTLQVGVITDVGGHCDSIAAYTAAVEDPLCQLGMVRAYADEYGIQVQGVLHVDVTQGQIDRALAGRPSGDWRPPTDGKLFGIAMVNTPGYVALIEEEEGVVTRMVASIPPPPPAGAPVESKNLFFDAPPSVVTAAGRGVPQGCSCGGTCGGCGVKPPGEPMTGADLAELASLDLADHTRKRLAKARAAG